MANKRMLVVDAYNVIHVLRRLGASFEEIAGLGWRVDGEPALKATGEVIGVWYEEEKQEREPKKRLEE